MTVALRGGTVIDSSGRNERADVVIGDDGIIVAVDTGLDGDISLDATDCIITSGFVDLHAHLREPGAEEAETIETGARGAALGGYTAVVAMPNTTPAMDCASVIRDVIEMARGVSCHVMPSAAITVGRAGRELSPMAELVRLGVRIFTDDGIGVDDAQVMRRALEYAGGLTHLTGGTPIVLAQHCEVASLSAGSCMHEGEWSSRLGLPGQPAEAEELMVMRDIALSRLTGTRVHFQHLSTAGSVAMVRAAKSAGLPITAEATTHHFTLTDAACATYDPVFKVHPPLRTEADVMAVKVGLADGTIDAIATDHAPHTPHAKEQPFGEAPPGMLGLQTAFALANTELDLPLADVLALLSWRPASVAGLHRHGRPVAPGEPANLTVIDPAAEWTIDADQMASRSRNSPYEGRTVRGKVRHTVFEGAVVVNEGEPQR